MPNHVETICSLTESFPAVEVFKNAHIKMVEEELVFDFNTVISMQYSCPHDRLRRRR